MKPRSKMKKIMAYFLPFMLMFSFYGTALAQEEIAFAKTGCEATRGCVLKNGHAGECVVQVAKNIQTAQTEKLLTVDAAATEEKGKLYPDVQSAINYIESQADKTEWTITLKTGEYARFTVLTGLDGLTIQAEAGADVKIKVCDESKAPVKASGAYPDTGGISIRKADRVCMKGLSFIMGDQKNPWLCAAVSNYAKSGEKGNGFTVSGCKFIGTDSNKGVFADAGTDTFYIKQCDFQGLEEAIYISGDGTVLASAEVSNNKFTGCGFAVQGSYGGDQGNAGVLKFTNNTLKGGETYCKAVLQDEENTAALKVDVRDNVLENALIGLVNLREQGETISDVLTSNTFGKNSFYVEAIEPGTIEFYTAYQAPQDANGHWQLTGKDDFDVDWGENPGGSTAKIQDLVTKAYENHDKTLKITGIDENNLIKTFTWFNDGIYWVSDAGEPGETETPAASPSQTAEPQPSASAAAGQDETNQPQTGDAANPVLWICVMVLALGGLAFGFWRLKKQKKN